MTARPPPATYQSYPRDGQDAPKTSPSTSHPYHRSPALPTTNPLYLREIRRLQEFSRRTDPEGSDTKWQQFMDETLDEHDRLYTATERFRCRICVLKAGKKGDKTCKCRRRVEAEEEKGTSIGDARASQKGTGGELKSGDEQNAREGAAAEPRVEGLEGLDIST